MTEEEKKTLIDAVNCKYPHLKMYSDFITVMGKEPISYRPE